MVFDSLRASLLAGLLIFAPALAQAKSYTIPDGNPAAVVTIPDSWDVTETKLGVEAESEDEEVYFAIEVTDWKDAAQSIAQSIIWLKSKDVEINRDSEERKTFELNGMQGVEVRWSGKDSDGPAKVSVTLIQVSETKGLVLTYWASPEGETANLKDLISIAQNLKPVR